MKPFSGDVDRPLDGLPDTDAGDLPAPTWPPTPGEHLATVIRVFEQTTIRGLVRQTLVFRLDDGNEIGSVLTYLAKDSVRRFRVGQRTLLRLRAQDVDGLIEAEIDGFGYAMLNTEAKATR